VVREVLIQSGDPDGLPGDRQAVMARARRAQLGGDLDFLDELQEETKGESHEEK
jgi:hypothetical protein